MQLTALSIKDLLFHISSQDKKAYNSARYIDSISFKVRSLFVKTISCLPLCINKSQLITLNITMVYDIMAHRRHSLSHFYYQVTSIIQYVQYVAFLL